jgi:hypothetical protein
MQKLENLMRDLFVVQKQTPARRFGISMGGISISRDGVTVHITAEGEILGEKSATNCDACFEPFAMRDMIRIIDNRFIICRGCYLKNHQK